MRTAAIKYAGTELVQDPSPSGKFPSWDDKILNRPRWRFQLASAWGFWEIFTTAYSPNHSRYFKDSDVDRGNFESLYSRRSSSHSFLFLFFFAKSLAFDRPRPHCKSASFHWHLRNAMRAKSVTISDDKYAFLLLRGPYLRHNTNFRYSLAQSFGTEGEKIGYLYEWYHTEPSDNAWCKQHTKSIFRLGKGPREEFNAAIEILDGSNQPGKSRTNWCQKSSREETRMVVCSMKTIMTTFIVFATISWSRTSRNETQCLWYKYFRVGPPSPFNLAVFDIQAVQNRFSEALSSPNSGSKKVFDVMVQRARRLDW